MNDRMLNKKEYLDLLREERARWEELLAGLSEEQIVAPVLDGGWSIKDVMAHLMAWQGITRARLQAALQGEEPEYTHWPEGRDPEAEEDLEEINAWIFSNYHDQSWASVQRAWREGFQQVLEAAEAIPESDLMETGKYAWLAEYPLSAVLFGMYDHHHEEHWVPLQAWLRDKGWIE
jgi:hypothetical protein